MTIFIEPFRKPNEHMTFLVSLLYGELAQGKKVIFFPVLIIIIPSRMNLEIRLYLEKLNHLIHH